MELKSYDKPWLPAFKGVFLILFGIIAMLGILGTIKSLGVLFVVLIAMIGVLLITAGLRFMKSGSRIWTIVSGIINLGFCLYLVLQVDKAKDLAEAREGVVMVILLWLLFYAIIEIIEAGILFSQKNAFAALFLINAVLTLVFAYFLNVVIGNLQQLEPSAKQSVFYIGVIALAVGFVNILSSYLLNRIKG